MSQIETVQLVEESRDALQNLRRSLIELYGAAGANPDTPQEVSRHYGINRNLSWKLSRVINALEPFSTLNHLPGPQGMELALKAFEKAGASSDVLESVRAAQTRLQGVVADHAGDREHLELTLESIGLFERDTMAESGRELAFRGNSMVWGVQASTRWATTFIGPGSDPDKMDMASVIGIIGFRRLRPGVQWRLLRTRLYDDKGGLLRPDNRWEEFEPKGPGDVPQQIREFCSANTPDLIVSDSADGREVLLPGGPVGNRGTFDIFTGTISRGLPRFATSGEKFASKATAVTFPIESLVFDLIVHRDIVLPEKLDVMLNGFPHGQMDDPRAKNHPLPMNESFFELAGSPPAVSTPAVPRITRMVDRIFARMKWEPSEFRGLRMQIKYPPMASVCAVQWPLPQRPVA